MFSPDVAGPSNAASLRPRRRQRNVDEDSIKLPKAKRQRSALRNDTFAPLEDADINAITGQANGELPVNGHANPPPPTPASTRQTRSTGGAGLQELSIAYRPLKKQEKRVERGDGGVILTKNDVYAVSQLPALPDRIRANGTALNAVIAAEYGYALALTQTQALVWPYASSSSSPAAKDIFSFTLPYPSRNAADSLPLGTFVSRSHSGYPGLVVIAPSSGKITYWEDISNAAVPGLGREKQNGFQGSISLLSGERVTAIENAEPAGFMLTLSSNRVAHLAVRDPQGKPAVHAEFLRGSGNGASGGGLFGSVRNIFGGGGWRKDVAAVRAGRTRQRGQRDVIIATKEGNFELWDTFLSIGDSMRAQLDAKDTILQSLTPAIARENPPHNLNFQVLDFAFGVEKGDKNELAVAGKDAPTPLVVLLVLADQMSVEYFLVELTLDNDGVDVEVVHPITCYKESLQAQAVWKLRLVIPKPGQMAFVIFRAAVVLFSLARIEESPSSQLALETNSLPAPFQDCIEFRDHGHQVKGLGIEDQGSDHKYASCVLMVENYGTIRVFTYPQKESEEISQPAVVTAKSKIEQAIFFGTLKQNPLDFSARSEQLFSLEEINDAALEIQGEILNSTSKFLPTVTPVLEHQLRLRAKALEDLALHLKRQYPPLQRKTRWLLLAGAEQMAASRALWTNQETLSKTKTENEKTLLALMLYYIHEKFKSQIDTSKGENDQVRHWFTHDTSRIGIVIPWSFQVLKETYKDGANSQEQIVNRISEANDIALSTATTAFQFRQTNASLYGLGDEDLEDGILNSKFEDVPEFWTSTMLGISQVEELLNTVLSTVSADWSNQTSDLPDPTALKKLGHDSPRLVEMYSQMVDERSRWSLARDDPRLRHEGENLQSSKVTQRRDMILAVGSSASIPDAIALAVKYKDMESLVELLFLAIDRTHKELSVPGIGEDEQADLKEKLGDWEGELNSYFEMFGDDWAQALFSRQIGDGLLGSVLHQSQYQSYLTRFFERNPGYEKLSWMNDVVGEGNYIRAAEHLNNLATEERSNVWSKKVELSMGRLAELACIESRYKGDPSTRVGNSKKAMQSKTFERQVALLDIQNLLYSHVQPFLRHAIDDEAEVQLAHEEFAADRVKGFPALGQLLKTGLARLVTQEVMSAEQLIDVLTLMDTIYNADEDPEESEVIAHEFYLALQCLGLTDVDLARKSVLEKIIWRRCMIRDNWIDINKTVMKDERQIEAETDATALSQTLREGFQNSIYPPPSLPKREFHPLAPSATLNAATNPDTFRSRFPDNDAKIREMLAEDMKKEDQTLRSYIEKARLGEWYPGIVEAAMRAVRDEADEKGEELGDAIREAETAVNGKQETGVRLVAHGRVIASGDGGGDVSMSTG